MPKPKTLFDLFDENDDSEPEISTADSVEPIPVDPASVDQSVQTEKTRKKSVRSASVKKTVGRAEKANQPKSEPIPDGCVKIAEEKTQAVPPEIPNPLSVSELTLKVKGLIEARFSDAWVIGQISNLSTPRSGHIYLTLKDDGAQLPAVLWKSTASKLRFKLTDGMEIVCRGRLDVYPPQGKYQLIVEEAEPKGIGTLELAFRQLHDKLAKQGFFAPERKKPLPRFIRKIALITSPSGAAVRDFLQVLGRRTRQVDILLVPVRVQGEGASAEIAEAIRKVNRMNRIDQGASQGEPLRSVDCIVVTRGGGSVEDLWAFNEEPLVRAVAESRLPVVSGVGHEVDVTLCDLVADVRALTPSEAAERISREDDDIVQELVAFRRRMEDSLEKKLRFYREKLGFVEKHPALTRPERIVEQRERLLDILEERLDRTWDRRFQTASQRLSKSAAALEALSPLSVLKRGYSLTETDSGQRIRSVEEVEEGLAIRSRFSDGSIFSIVQKIEKRHASE